MEETKENRAKRQMLEILRAYRAVNPETGRTYSTVEAAYGIANLVERWINTNDPSFMDSAIRYCEQEDLPILPLLRFQLAAAAVKRGDGKLLRSERGKLLRSEREGIKGEAFRGIANLVISGQTLTRAAEIVTVWMRDFSPYRMKASSLEREYLQVWRSGNWSLEDELRKFIRECPNSDIEKQWQEIARKTRAPEDDEKGERR